jgi:tetratricopeptide (TPR) repeat protein
MAACSRAPQRSVDRVAILPFENLTGDASLDWIASSAPTIVASQMAGTPKIVSLRAPSISEGYLAAADRFVHGYFTRSRGALRFEIEQEDAATHKMTAYITETGALLPAMNAAAKVLDPAARAFSTANEEAVQAWGSGDYERAVSIDPDFGDAWLSWIQSLTQKGETADAISVAARALARPGLRSELSKARIEVVSASLSKNRSAEEQALTKLSAMVPQDTALLANLADVEMLARNFSGAADQYRKILAVNPNDAAALNSLGYAEGFAGNLDAAHKAFEDYGKQPGQKANSLDSNGEVEFANGNFAAAEKYFVDAHQMAPAFLGGADLLKAAYAHWLGNRSDLKGADAIMAQYLDFRRSAHDQAVAWHEAQWDYATGRKDLAIEKLKSASGVPPSLIERQAAVWQGPTPVANDVAALKQKYDQTPPSADGQIRVFYAAALIAAGEKDAARKILTRWPMPGETGSDPLFDSLLFPKFIELRKAAGL